MVRIAYIAALVTALCASARAEDVPQRGLEELVAVSPAVVVGKVTEAGGEVKDGDATCHKYAVAVSSALRAAADGPKEKAAVIVCDDEQRKVGDEFIWFLGRKIEKGLLSNGVLKVDQLKAVHAALELEAKAEKELGGKDRVAAAFYLAHRLRPVLLAEAEGKGVAPAGAIDADQKDKLLTVLVWALNEAARKGASADLQRQTDLLQKVLSGTGGLPAFAMRRELAAQFWTRRLANEQIRKAQPLMALKVTDQPAAAQKQAAQQVVVAGGNVQVILRPGMPPVVMTPGQPGTAPAAEPAPVEPPESAFGTSVNGIVAGLRTDRAAYDFAGDPKREVHVTATFRNDGANVVLFNSYLLFQMLSPVRIVDPRGRVLPYPGKEALETAEIPAMGAWSFKEIKPGQKLEFAAAIPAARFPRSGEYKLYVVYENSYGPQFGLKNAWAGRVVSDAAVISVARAEAKPAALVEPAKDGELGKFPAPAAPAPAERQVLPVPPGGNN